jgi:hypothetical protein
LKPTAGVVVTIRVDHNNEAKRLIAAEQDLLLAATQIIYRISPRFD